MKRKAIVKTTEGAVVERYLPSNYKVVGTTPAPEYWTVIEGEDNAGWTLDDYVIPRLASGLYAAEEVTYQLIVPTAKEMPSQALYGDCGETLSREEADAHGIGIDWEPGDIAVVCSRAPHSSHFKHVSHGHDVCVVWGIGDLA